MNRSKKLTSFVIFSLISLTTWSITDTLDVVIADSSSIYELDWAELSLEHQIHFAKEAWTPEKWDSMEDMEDIESFDWDDLSPETRGMMEGQGWTREKWEGGEKPYRELEWEDLGHYKHAIVTLGWTEEMWDSDLVYIAPVERQPWQNLTDSEREAAEYLLIEKHAWESRRLKYEFNPIVVKLSIPELEELNFDYLSTLNVTVELQDGNTLGDDENCLSQQLSMKDFISEMKNGSQGYLKYEDRDPFKEHVREQVGNKVLKYIRDALVKSPLRESGHFPPIYDELELNENNWAFWLGGKNTSTSMHFDVEDVNFLWVVEGKKRVIIIPNDERTEGTYKCGSSSYAEHSCWTGVDILHGDDLPPHAIEIELGPGEGVLIPYVSWHAVKNLEASLAYGLRININDYAMAH